MDSQVGREVARFRTKEDKEAVIRYLQFEDLHKMLSFINEVSKEDTYLTPSGEQYSFDDEVSFVAGELREIVKGNTVLLLCFVEGELAATFSARRHLAAKKRELHIATLGLIVSNGFRNKGIGKKLMEIGMNEAMRAIQGLQILRLQVFSNNEIARQLYTTLGFYEYGRLPGGVYYRGSYVDHIYMYKRINE